MPPQNSVKINGHMWSSAHTNTNKSYGKLVRDGAFHRPEYHIKSQWHYRTGDSRIARKPTQTPLLALPVTAKSACS